MDIEYIKDLFKDKKDNTLQNYITILSQFTDKKILNFKRTKKFIENMKDNRNGKGIKSSTKKNYYLKLVSYIEKVYTLIDTIPNTNPEITYGQLRQKYYELASKHKNQYEKDKDDEILPIDYETLKETIMNIEDKKSQDFILLYLYLTYPVRSDYKDILIRKYDPKEDSHIDIKKKQIVLIDRTKINKETKIKLTKESLTYLKDYIDSLSLNRNKLFTDFNKNEIKTQDVLLKAIKRSCRNNCLPELTINDFRKIVETNFWKNAPSNKEIEKQMDTLGHTSYSSLKYYRKQ